MLRAISIGLVACGLVVLAVGKGEAAPPPVGGDASSLPALRQGPMAALTLSTPLAKVPEVFPSLGAPVPSPEATPDCAEGMVEVEGDYCPYVYERCLWWLDPKTKLQCAQFAPSSACMMKTQHRKFCIDKYEWPNKYGEKPVYMVSWNEAKASCESIGKRLCSDTEWTVACEGPEHLPYPYGYKRDPKACNIDKPYPTPHPELVYDPVTQPTELARLDQREPSGARDRCVSPYGVNDMAGNVDEWVVNETQNGWPHMSGLKGGYWGPVRTRCRPMTTAHEETFRYYQIGFRCCGDPSSAKLQSVPPSGGS
jgi:Sulfatase-modifying factor enzyme 1